MSDTLSKEQKDAVAKWVADGASLSEVQKRIHSEFGVSITYMEVRFLIDDIGATPVDKSPPPPQPAPPQAQAANRPKQAAGANTGSVADMLIDDANVGSAAGDDGADSDSGGDSADASAGADAADAGNAPGGAGRVSITVDAVQRPGEVASGGVTFSDGETGQWFLDGYGRLGFEPPYKDYKPSPADVRQFQTLLQKELSKGGYGAY